MLLFYCVVPCSWVFFYLLCDSVHVLLVLIACYLLNVLCISYFRNVLPMIDCAFFIQFVFLLFIMHCSYSLLFPFIDSLNLLWIYVTHYFPFKTCPCSSLYSLHIVRWFTSLIAYFLSCRPRSPPVSPAEQLSEVRQGPSGYVGTLLLRPPAGWAHLHVLPLRGDGRECPRALRSRLPLVHLFTAY